MSINSPVPDYELADTIELTTAEQVRAISDPLRTTILGLLHERAAERFYGRAARMFYIGLGRQGGELPHDFNDFEVAAEESKPAYEAGQMYSFIRHARIPEERAAEFWREVDRLIHHFDKLPRSGDTTYGFTVGLYPILDYPTLPPAADEER